MLDHLHARDGQRLGELCERFDVSRQAVSKHLGVLQDAALAAGRQHGRQLVFFPDRGPIRTVHREWIDEFVR